MGGKGSGQRKHSVLSADAETMTGECLECGPNVPMLWQKGGGGSYRWRCARARHMQGLKHARLGFSLDDKLRMIAAQGGKCKICETPIDQRTGHVDHCHSTGRIRGVLCSRCNLGIGYFRDDVFLLQKVIAYLLR